MTERNRLKLTHTRRLILCAGAFCYLAAGTPYAGTVNLPDLGDASAAVISPAQERKLGEEFMRRARASLAFVDDPELDDYLQSLGERLVAHGDAARQEFRFFLVDDPSINAFAVPGGFIGVHTGLVLAVESEAELASVLAHETAHITQRHIPRLVAEQQRASLPAMAALLASILLATSGQRGAEAGIALTTATMAQKGINYTRAFEEEADRLGMSILARAEFDPSAMPAFFERMQMLNRHNETNLPEFLRTHPVTSSRIADARNRAEQLTYRQTPDSEAFHHVRAKIRARAPGNPIEIVQGFRGNLSQGKYLNADAERYGYALALLRNKQIREARAEIEKLIAHAPDVSRYRVAQAEVEMAAANYAAALSIYDAAHKKWPSQSPLVRGYATALLKAGKPREAHELLKPVLRKSPTDPMLYRMTAQAAGDAGVRIEAHQAMAEYYYLIGNANAAIEQLRIATRFAGDNFYLQSSLEARIAAIKDEVALYHSK